MIPLDAGIQSEHANSHMNFIKHMIVHLDLNLTSLGNQNLEIKWYLQLVILREEKNIKITM